MSPLTRRHFIRRSAALATGSALAASSPAGSAPAPVPTPASLIDCNVTLGPWPFRELPGVAHRTLVERMKQRGVTQAFAGSTAGIFQRDLFAANKSLHDTCTRQSEGIFLPAGSINPIHPGWKAELQRCVSDHGMKIIRLHPNYHGYTLADPSFRDLLEAATAHRLLVQITAQIEDERTQHPLVKMKPVDLRPLPAALQRVSGARVMVLNASRAMSMTALQNCPVWIDFAMLEGVGGVENLLRDWPLEKLVFGSHAPFFYWESARLKLQESDLSAKQLAAITHENARRSLQG